jgi:hypothetical protein
MLPGLLGQRAQRGVERAADMDQADLFRLQGFCRAHEGGGVLLAAHVAYHRHVKISRRGWGMLVDRLERRCGLVDDPGLAARCLVEHLQAGGLQHHQVCGQLQRTLRVRVAENVPVQIGAGEHDDQRPSRKGRGKRGDG